MKKRLLAGLLTLAMLFTLLPTGAFADFDTGHQFQVKVAKVYVDQSGNQETTWMTATCRYSSNHSSGNCKEYLKCFYPTNFGWSAGDDWLGYRKDQYGTWTKNSQYNSKFYNWTKDTIMLTCSSGSDKAWDTIYLVYKSPTPATYTYKVTHIYYTNGAEDGRTTSSINNVMAGTTVQASNITKVTNYEGGTYAYTSANPESATISNNATVFSLTYNRYKYSIVYDSQGGSAVESTTQFSTNESANLNVTNDKPTKENCTFVGWAKTAGATEPDAEISYTLTSSNPTKTLYAVWKEEEIPENPPAKPSNDEVIKLLNQVVKVDCVNETVTHEDKTYDLIDDSFTIGSVSEPSTESDKYTCAVTIFAEKYVGAYNTDVAEGHTLKSTEDGSKTVTLIYDEDKWTVADNATPIIFEVECENIPDPKPDWEGLTIKKTVEPKDSEINPGDTVTYTITVANNTGKDLTDITVSEKLDSNLVLDSVSPDGQYDEISGVWKIPSLENSKEATLTIQATVNKDAEAGTISNTVTITGAKDGDNELPDEDKPTNSVTITITTPDTPPADDTDWSQLTVNKAVDEPEVKPGDTVTYTITVTNNTGKNLTSVTVEDILDEKLTFVSADGEYGDGVWTIDTLANGETAALKITATVNTDVQVDDIIPNKAIITDAADEDGNKLPEDKNPSSSADVIVISGTDTPVDPTPGGDDKPTTPDDGSGSSGGSDASSVLVPLAIGAAAVAVPFIVHYYREKTAEPPAEVVEEAPAEAPVEEVPAEVIEAEPVPKTGDTTHPVALALGGAAMLALGGALGRKRRDDEGDER